MPTLSSRTAACGPLRDVLGTQSWHRQILVSCTESAGHRLAWSMVRSCTDGADLQRLKQRALQHGSQVTNTLIGNVQQV